MYKYKLKTSKNIIITHGIIDIIPKIGEKFLFRNEIIVIKDIIYKLTNNCSTKSELDYIIFIGEDILDTDWED